MAASATRCGEPGTPSLSTRPSPAGATQWKVSGNGSPSSNPQSRATPARRSGSSSSQRAPASPHCDVTLLTKTDTTAEYEEAATTS